MGEPGFITGGIEDGDWFGGTVPVTAYSVDLIMYFPQAVFAFCTYARYHRVTV